MDSFHETMFDLSFPFYSKSQIKLQHRIGAGYVGEVYLGSLTIDDETTDCVVKKVSSDNYDEGIDDSMLYQDIIDEVRIGEQFMGKSKHQIQFYGYSMFKKKGQLIIYLLMEKTNAKGDISSYIASDKFWKRLTKKEYNESKSQTVLYHEDKYWDYIVPVKDKLNLMYQMCLAVQELHTFNVVHCDLKPSNMLFTGEKVKLIDYNASQKIENEEEIQGPSEMGTPGYMAKEMYDGWISYKADIYSLGVSMLEIWFGDIWCKKSDNYLNNRKYVLDYLSILKKDNFKLYSLINQCVSVDQDKRPHIQKLLSNLDHIQSLNNLLENEKEIAE